MLLCAHCCAQELVGQLRGRIADLEAAAVQHQRQLAAAQQHAEALESRLTTAELAAARSAAEVRPGGAAGGATPALV